MLYSIFIIWYLFLGGTAGALATMPLMLRALSKRLQPADAQMLPPLRRNIIVASAGCLALGCIFLVKDLPAASGVWVLLTRPTLNLLSLGAYALFLLGVVLATSFVLDVLKRKKSWFRVTAVSCDIICAVLGLIVVLYTGIFLAGTASVPFWKNAFLPLLFLASSFSTGLCVVAAISLFCSERLSFRQQVTRHALAVDLGVIVFEALVTVGLLLTAGLLGHDAAARSVETLLMGGLAQEFWLGFVACGMVVPAAIELFARRGMKYQPMAVFVVAGLVLVGGFYLRYCVIAGGTHFSAYLFL